LIEFNNFFLNSNSFIYNIDNYIRPSKLSLCQVVLDNNYDYLEKHFSYILMLHSLVDQIISLIGKNNSSIDKKHLKASEDNFKSSIIKDFLSIDDEYGPMILN
jgi:hypothetical protein